MWRLPIWTLLALHRIHSAGAQGTVWATFSTWNWRRGSGGWKRGAPLRHRVWPKLDHLLYVSILSASSTFGALFGVGQCPRYFWPFWTEKMRLLGEVEKSRGAVCGPLWVPSGRGRRGASFNVLAPLNSLSSWSCLTSSRKGKTMPSKHWVVPGREDGAVRSWKEAVVGAQGAPLISQE